MEEIWKDIPGYEGLYKVSNYGNIKGLERVNNYGRRVHGRDIVKKKDKKGYLFVGLSKNGKSKPFKVHRLVAELFIEGKSETNNQVDHIDNDITNNNYLNLRWVSNTINCRNKRNNRLVTVDGVTKTLQEWGEISGTNPLTIRRRIEYGWEPKDAVYKKVIYRR